MKYNLCKIINYSKAEEGYAENRKHGYGKKFYEELNEEYKRVPREKKQTYAGYRQARRKMKDAQIAKYNLDRFLRKEEEERQAEKNKKQEHVR